MTLTELDIEVRKNFNSLVLLQNGSIGRLIGYKETDEDLYFILNLNSNYKIHTIYLNCSEDISYLDRVLTTEQYLKFNQDYIQLLPEESLVVIETLVN